MKYAVADTTNGILETYTDHLHALMAWNKYVTDGMCEEVLVQDETGLTLTEIEAKVKDFYRLIVIEEPRFARRDGKK